jgi:hypothetical protein
MLFLMLRVAIGSFHAGISGMDRFLTTIRETHFFQSMIPDVEPIELPKAPKGAPIPG